MNASQRPISSWTLGRDQIDLWCVRWDAALALQVEGEYRAVLPPAEAAACDRFVFESGRHQCLISRVLARTALSAYTDVLPESWRFSTNPFGKPHIADPADCPLRFNLSHTSGMIVCAVSRGRELGVDVEDLRRRVADESIARHYFAADEVASLLAVPPVERPARFLEFWTLKEAFLKAHGAGLSIPLKSFSFTVAADQSPQIHFHDPSLGDPRRWQFLAFRFDDRYQMAVAVERPHESPLVVRWVDTVPLRHVRLGGSLV
jgi:4'-phosphopantetheinyl transferase